MTSIISRVALMAAATVAFAGAASAATTMPEQDVFAGVYTATDWEDGLPATFSLFNTSLGTLTGIYVRDTYGFNSTLSVTNSAAALSNTRGTVATKSLMDISAGTNAANNLTQASYIANLLSTNYLTGTDSAAFNIAPGTTVSNLTSTLSYDSGYKSGSLTQDIINAFSAGVNGNGTKGSLLATTDTLTVLSTRNGNSSADQSTAAIGSFYIYYTYTPADNIAAVPETATWAMILVGFGGMGAALRRGRSTQLKFG